ncbi:ELO domain containing protein, partial [Asbolus verrucosus]
MGDPRSKMYPLMGSPLPFVSIFTFYIVFNFKIGPAIMNKRELLKIRELVMSYNLLQIVSNTMIFIFGITLLPRVSIWCTPLDTSANSPFVTAHYLYLILKVFDLVDTNRKQITVLHVYHHVLMALRTWVLFMNIPGGQVFFVGFLNCFVHIIMYTYYFLISWDPKYKKRIRWKKRITQLQI